MFSWVKFVASCVVLSWSIGCATSDEDNDNADQTSTTAMAQSASVGDVIYQEYQTIAGKVLVYKGTSIITIFVDNPAISAIQIVSVVEPGQANGTYFYTNTASVRLAPNDIINRLRPALAKGVEISLTYVTGIDPNASPNMVELRIGTQTFPLTI